MHRLRSIQLTTVATAALAALADHTPAQSVSPASRTDAEGSSSTSYPLGRYNARLQQIHADLPASLSTIAGHAYRRDAIATIGRIPSFQTELEITVSVAQNPPASASRTFAQNRGPAPVVVLPRQLVSFPATDRPGTAPVATFEHRIPYATPFPRAAGAVVCVETVVFGNRTSSGPDRNFTAYLDAHVLSSDGSNTAPGYRFGTGCPASGRQTAHYASMVFARAGDGSLELRVGSRYGAASDAAGPGGSALLLGLATASAQVPWLPACTLWTSTDVVLPLAGTTDASGHQDVTIPGLGNLAPGLRIEAQVASGNLATGELTLSDGSSLQVPGIETVPIQACRVASGSNRDATTGTRSFAVPVTEFF